VKKKRVSMKIKRHPKTNITRSVYRRAGSPIIYPPWNYPTACCRRSGDGYQRIDTDNEHGRIYCTVTNVNVQFLPIIFAIDYRLLASVVAYFGQFLGFGVSLPFGRCDGDDETFGDHGF